jgi:hypothetical protein
MLSMVARTRSSGCPGRGGRRTSASPKLAATHLTNNWRSGAAARASAWGVVNGGTVLEQARDLTPRTFRGGAVARWRCRASGACGRSPSGQRLAYRSWERAAPEGPSRVIALRCWRSASMTSFQEALRLLEQVLHHATQPD